jgi:hypothetical protein
MGTFVMTLLAVVPILNFINLFCCAGIILGGLTGTYFYNREIADTNLQLQNKDGVIIGILSGIITAIIATGVSVLFSMFTQQNPITETMVLFEGMDLPPEFHEQLNKLSNEYNQYGYSPTMTIISFVMYLILYPLFGALGGMIGVAILKKKNVTPQ